MMYVCMTAALHNKFPLWPSFPFNMQFSDAVLFLCDLYFVRLYFVCWSSRLMHFFFKGNQKVAVPYVNTDTLTS